MKINAEKLQKTINKYWTVKHLAEMLWVHRQAINTSLSRKSMRLDRLEQIVRALNILEDAEVKIRNGFITRRLKYKVEDFIEKV